MSPTSYSSKDALKVLIQKVGERSAELARRIQEVIDTGKDILTKVEEPSESGKGRKRKRQFWTRVPYSDEEALAAALGLLESHLVETRLALNQSLIDFKEAGESLPKPIKRPGSDIVGYGSGSRQLSLPVEDEEVSPPPVENVGRPKRLQVEGEPEQLQEKLNAPDLVLEATALDQLASLREALRKVGALTLQAIPSHGNPR